MYWKEVVERAARRRSAQEAAEPIVVTSADHSADHMVTVSVDIAGQLVDLRLHQDALRRTIRRAWPQRS